MHKTGNTLVVQNIFSNYSSTASPEERQASHVCRGVSIRQVRPPQPSSEPHFVVTISPLQYLLFSFNLLPFDHERSVQQHPPGLLPSVEHAAAQQLASCPTHVHDHPDLAPVIHVFERDLAALVQAVLGEVGHGLHELLVEIRVLGLHVVLRMGQVCEKRT